MLQDAIKARLKMFQKYDEEMENEESNEVEEENEKMSDDDNNSEMEENEDFEVQPSEEGEIYGDLIENYQICLLYSTKNSLYLYLVFI